MNDMETPPAPEQKLHMTVFKVLIIVVWIEVKMTLILAFLNKNVADFVYGGF